MESDKILEENETESQNFYQIKSNSQKSLFSNFVNYLIYKFLYFLINLVKKREKNQKYNIKMGRNCLCDTLSPILLISQILGLVPLHLSHLKNKDGATTGCCLFIFRWVSASGFFSTFLIFLYVSTAPLAYSELRGRMGLIFNGTDFYAFLFQTNGMYFQAGLIVIMGRLMKNKFAKGWEELTNVYHSMCDSTSDLKKIKIFSYLALIVLIVEISLFFIFNLYFGAKSTGIGFYESCLAVYVGSLFLTLNTSIPYVFSTLFLFICLLLRQHFLKITEMVRTVVTKRKSEKFSARLDSLRVLHEELCSAVSHFEDFFGMQVLLTLCMGCFTMVTGAYACILKGEGMTSSKGEEMTVSWAAQLYCASLFIFVIIVAGQTVSNAAISPAPILNGIPLTDLDDEGEKQVRAFLTKISAFPTTIKALKITNISTTFFATALTNIITYLLVLMQFRLSIETLQKNSNISSNSTDFSNTSNQLST